MTIYLNTPPLIPEEREALEKARAAAGRYYTNANEFEPRFIVFHHAGFIKATWLELHLYDRSVKLGRKSRKSPDLFQVRYSAPVLLLGHIPYDLHPPGECTTCTHNWEREERG